MLSRLSSFVPNTNKVNWLPNFFKIAVLA
jgi:hypothetical protein